MSVRRTTAAAVVVACVCTACVPTACGTISEPAPPAAAPDGVDVNVRLVDAPPGEILTEGDGICSWSGERPVVTLRDAAGEVLGVEDLQDGGGIYDDATGCTWSVTFLDVPSGPSYEASVEQGDVFHSATGSVEGSRSVTIEF